MKNKLLFITLIIAALTGCNIERNERKIEEKKLITALESATYYEDKCLRREMKKNGKKWLGRANAMYWIQSCSFHSKNMGDAFRKAVLNGVARVEIDNARKRGEKASEIDNAK